MISFKTSCEHHELARQGNDPSVLFTTSVHMTILSIYNRKRTAENGTFSVSGLTTPTDQKTRSAKMTVLCRFQMYHDLMSLIMIQCQLFVAISMRLNNESHISFSTTFQFGIMQRNFSLWNLQMNSLVMYHITYFSLLVQL